MGLLYYISYAAVLAAFAFVTLSLASGLLYISELIEEHSRLAKIYGQRGVYIIILLHIVLYFSDSLPFPQTAFSVLCHVIYLQNFSASWPVISLTAPSFLASCLFVVSDHFLWFFYFARVTQEARHLRTYRGPVPDPPGFLEIASFFGICVWLAPLFLFLSLSANDNALPVSAAEPGSPLGSSTIQFAQNRVSLFRSMFSLGSLPKLRRKSSRKNTAEGLLAPHSQKPPHSPLHPPSPTISQYNNLSPPRSPSINRFQDLDGHLSVSQSFKLNTPPKRSSPMRRQTSMALGQNGSDISGLGLRRTSSSSTMNDDSMIRE